MACIFMTEETLEELVPLHLAAIELANLRSDLGIKDARIEELKEALRFYADNATYKKQDFIEGCDVYLCTRIETDRGQKAWQALTKHKGEV